MHLHIFFQAETEIEIANKIELWHQFSMSINNYQYFNLTILTSKEFVSTNSSDFDLPFLQD